jgi:drug/metabolite transporter (DMT)-like permease
MKVRLAYALLCLIWGSTWMAIRVVVNDVPPMRAAALRFIIAALILLPFVLVQRRKWPASRHEGQTVGVLGLAMIALPYGLIFWAEQYVSSSLTAVLYASLPLANAVLTPAVLGHSIPPRAFLSLLVAMGGIAYLFNVNLIATRQTFLGGALILIGVVSSAFANVYAKKRAANIDAAVSSALQFVIAGVLLSLAALTEIDEPASWSVKAVVALVFLSTAGSAVAFAVYYWLLKQIPAHKASTITLVVPFIAILEGALLLQEMVTIHMLAAAIVVLGAVAVVLRAEIEKSAQLGLSREAT